MLIRWLNLQWLVDALFGDAWFSLGLSDASVARLCSAAGVSPDVETSGD